MAKSGAQPRRTSPSSPGAEQQVATFVAKFAPEHQRLIRALRKGLRRLFPTAYELVYDNYNFFVIGYSGTERPSDAIVSLAAGANGVSLCFIHGASLPDPKKILQGSGNQTRFVRLESGVALAQPEIRAVIAAAIARAKAPLRTTGRRAVIIKSVSAKQRPRRKGGG